MSDSARDIENLIYTYAERLDAGDLDGVAELFAHGRICGMENGPPETVFTGTGGCARCTRWRPGSTRTGHPRPSTTPAMCRLRHRRGCGNRRGSAYYCVTQATPDLPLQVIVTGHYHDTFHRIDGVWWFDSRMMFVDQVGDTSHHLKF